MKTKLFLLCLLPLLAHAGYEDWHDDMNANNAAMRTCLLANGYSGDVFYSYNFGKAASCFHSWKEGQLKADYIEAQMWLEENPWYKGTRWNWEQIQKQYPGTTTIKRY